MAKNSQASPLAISFLRVGRNLPTYGITLVLALLAIPLGFRDGLPYALAALLLAALSFYTVNRLLGQKAAAEFQKACSDEQVLQSQKLTSLGELSAGIAHEINNPLAIIRQEAEGLLNLCKKESPLEVSETKISVTEIIYQVDRTREIIHNLLNFARRNQPVIQGVQLNRLIEDMALLVEKTAPQGSFHLVKHLQPDLPLIKSDPPMLRQVILNLLNNAIQATGPDGTITVVTQAAANNHVMIQVNDTGCGIPKEHLSQIFDPFFTTKSRGKATGLGLSICHGIIERLGGKIFVTSEEGQGSSFIIDLPQVLDQKKI
jgi:two-component system NtrC family sensor kinase